MADTETAGGGTLLTPADVRTLELPTTRKGDVRPEGVERLREQVCETLAGLYGQISKLESDATDQVAGQNAAQAAADEQIEQLTAFLLTLK